MSMSNPATELYNKIKSNYSLRKRFSPFLTEADDPYFDVFLAVICFWNPRNVERVICSDLTNTDVAEYLMPITELSICEIGKGPYSRAFRIFGRKYLAVSDDDTRYPNAPAPELYEGTCRKEFIDLRFFPESSLHQRKFDITLSNSLLGDPYSTHLLAGKPSKAHMKLCRNPDYQRFFALASIRNMFAVFSNITKLKGISVHRCDRPLLEELVKENYFEILGFSVEALLEPEIEGGFIKNETIAVLKKQSYPKNGYHHIYVSPCEMLYVEEGICRIKEINDKFGS